VSDSVRIALVRAQDILQWLAMVLVAGSALTLCGLSIAAALGYVPWLVMSAQIGDVVYPQAGMAVQLAVTALMLTLCFYLPANARMQALERSHRAFHVGMQDVTQAYAVAHRSDRDGVFTLRSEFDSIRERIAFLRQHPDLPDLEAGVIDLAAQMSHISRELAQTYSDNNVGRARDFLIQRQQEIEDFNERLEDAKAITNELKRWHGRVDLEESTARSQLDWLQSELAEILPAIFATGPEEPAEIGSALAQETADTAAKTEAASDPQITPYYAPPRAVPEMEIVQGGDDERIVALLQRRAQR